MGGLKRMEDFWNEQTILETLVLMINEYTKNQEKWSIEELDAIFNLYMSQDEKYRKKNAEYLTTVGLEALQETKLDENAYFIMSFLLYATKNQTLYCEMIDYCMKDSEITKETKFFLYYQFVRFNFINQEAVSDEVEDLLDDLYSCIYQEYYMQVEEEYTFIPKVERKSDFVIVLISQILDMGHGPTKTLLDRCRILEEVLNKKVYIINTAECMSKNGEVKFFGKGTANYLAEFCNKEWLEYNGREYLFYQCPEEMPSVPIIREILEVIKTEKPYFILTIGGNSIVSDICSNVIPTIAISLAPSDKTITRGQFQAIGRRISDREEKWMIKHNYSKEHMIESLFTSAFKAQTHKYTREQLGLPKEGVIAVLIGGRLDWDIDAKCLKMLFKLMEKGIYIAFVGEFLRYDKIANENEIFKQYGVNLGFQDDVLAVCECCDLYINPKRMGGGTSVAEALHKGLPVVTMNYGDGAVGTGEDFWVVDYDEMYRKVLKYASDKEFYDLMSNKAKERAVRLMDSETEFVKIITKMEQSENF